MALTSAALTNVPGLTPRSSPSFEDKSLHLQILSKLRLGSGGQVEDATGPVLLRTCITEFSICWCFPAAKSLCPCITLLEAVQELIELSIVTSVDSVEILNLAFEGESSAGYFLRAVPDNPWMRWGKKAK